MGVADGYLGAFLAFLNRMSLPVQFLAVLVSSWHQ
jgi:hypothetical protein